MFKILILRFLLSLRSFVSLVCLLVKNASGRKVLVVHVLKYYSKSLSNVALKVQLCILHHFKHVKDTC